MAFSFGSSTPAFGSSAPAFGVSSAPAFSAFGASSAAGFGQSTASSTFSFSGFGASSSSAFGSAAAPAFGAASTTSLFATSSPAFGASTTPSLFGASTTSAFGAPPRPAGNTGALFSFAQSSPSLFSFSSAPAQAASNASLLFSAASQPASALQPESHLTYSTKWEEIPAALQQKLLELQNVISAHRGDCEVLDKDPRLHDANALKKSLEEEASALQQTFVNLLHAVKVDDAAMVDFRQKVMKLIYSTEAVVRVFHRAKAWRDYPQKYKGQQQVLPAALYEELTVPVLLPSPFLDTAVEGFKATLQEYKRCVSELEEALPSTGMGSLKDSDADITQTLPLIISNLHDYFLHVAADLERLHNKLHHSKSVFLERQRQQGNFVDPFEEARRQNRHKLATEGFQRGAETANPPDTSAAATTSAAAQPALTFSQPGTNAPQPTAAPAATTSLFPTAATPSLFSAPSAPVGGNVGQSSSISRGKSGRGKKK